MKMKKVLMCGLLFLLIVATIYCMWIQKYNYCVQDLNERYLYFYEDLQHICENNDIPFEEINSEYAFFITTYAEWESLYRTNYKRNMVPRIHEELGIAPEDAVEAYRSLRDFYYRCVQEVYFDENAANENMTNELDVINEKFNVLFEELHYFN